MASNDFTRAEDLTDTEGCREAGGKPDLSLLLGTWLNTDRSTKWIARIVLEPRDDGLWLYPFGATPQGAGEWGAVGGKGVFARGVISQEGMAFTAHYRFGPWETPLRGYWNNGLLVVAGLNTFRDGKHQPSYLSREFFRRKCNGVRGAECRVDPHPLVGTWWNANQVSSGIERIILTLRDNALRVHVWGACSPSARDWGEVPGQLYTEAAEPSREMCIAASYNFGFLETDLHAYEKKGVLVVESFNSFKDGSRRSPYFAREFFYR